jgi:hypothetical protein
MKIAIHILLILLLLDSATLSHAQNPPSFEDFRISKRYPGKPVPPKIKFSGARMFKTRIREGAKEGPNFAGYCTIVTWGCGSGCISFAVVDARTGQIYFHPEISSITTGMDQEDKLQYRLNSRLLIVTGRIRDEEGHHKDGRYYYEWERNQFRMLQAARK